MKEDDIDFRVSRLGECQIPSPLTGVRFVNDGEHVLYHSDLEGVKSLWGEVLAENVPMLGLVKKMGFALEPPEEGVRRVGMVL